MVPFAIFRLSLLLCEFDWGHSKCDFKELYLIEKEAPQQANKIHQISQEAAQEWATSAYSNLRVSPNRWFLC